MNLGRLVASSARRDHLVQIRVEETRSGHVAEYVFADKLGQELSAIYEAVGKAVTFVMAVNGGRVQGRHRSDDSIDI